MSGVDTIYALSSGGMPSGVAVVRISGGAVAAVAEIVCGGLPAARYASLRPIRSRNGEVLDEGLVIYFPGPASFTGEDVLEIHLHGSRAVAAAVLSELVGFTGLRMAEAGEFSRRAYLNGKKDLAAVEGLADLIAAETETQRRFAQGNSSGVQSRLYQSWRQRIIDMRSLIEAELDFADEGDIAGSVSDLVWVDAARLGDEIRGHLAGFKRAEIVLDGFKVVLAGAPNAGKSSLLNALAKRDAAIVSDEPGTTRDLVDVSLDLGGMKVVLTDTAGIRAEPGRVEKIGIERARQRIFEADLVVELVDLSNPADVGLQCSAPVLRVGSKKDMAAGTVAGLDASISIDDEGSVARLLDAIEQRAFAAGLRSGEIAPSRIRHVDLLSICSDQLEKACGMVGGLELKAEHLRRAGDALGMITGSIGVEDMLDVIFSRFCIGK